MKSALEWKAYYAQERAELGEAGLLALIDRAAESELPNRALVRGRSCFRTLRLADSGHLAAAARSCRPRGV